ncbi:MAG: CRTAC1 family protein [Thermoanaerobaculia bacterium]|nr:CRTAC1 family protein [Thermoanaerobaculia bacterium]
MTARRIGLQLVCIGMALLVASCTPPSPETSTDTPPLALPTSILGFTDVTAEAGIDFVHDNGASARRFLPETMGSGVAFFDVDGDDLPDLFFVAGVSVDSALGSRSDGPSTPPDTRPAGRLYRNLGNGSFEDITDGAGIGSAFLAMGTAIGDVDNDGWIDLFVSGVGDQRLYRNLGEGRFEDITERSGLGMKPGTDDVGFGSSAAFFDADRDGDLDLVVGRYVPWSPSTDRRCRPDGEHQTYCTPEVYDSAPNVFYRNLGNGAFADSSRESGLADPAGKTLGLAVVDVNRDGWPDLAVANDTDRNHLFINDGHGGFDEMGIEHGLAFSVSGATRGAMGIDAGDLDEDGLVDLAIGNFAQEMTALYLGTPAGLFRDEAAQLGIGIPSLMQVVFGTRILDLDLDGHLDLAFASGHIEPEIDSYQSVLSYRQPLGIYRNTATDGTTGSFIQVQSEAGPLAANWVGRGLASADFDGDGDLDLVLTQNGDSARLLRNDLRSNPLQTTSAAPHWLRLRLVGSQSPRTPYMTRVTAIVGEHRLERWLGSGHSYLSASEPVVTFGLGTIDAIDRLEIEWPSGQIQSVPSPLLTQLLVVEESSADPTEAP